jgi:hypothetical protein
LTGDRSDLVWLLNQYREAELRGAGAILRLLRLADTGRLRRDLTRHLRDETLHALLWTEAIESIGGEIVEVPDPYQARLGAHFGIPSSLNELLALTLVSERRGVTEYRAAMSRELPPPVEGALRTILEDEGWHVSYIARELEARSASDPDAAAALERAEAADRAAVADLLGTA